MAVSVLEEQAAGLLRVVKEMVEQLRTTRNIFSAAPAKHGSQEEEVVAVVNLYDRLKARKILDASEQENTLDRLRAELAQREGQSDVAASDAYDLGDFSPPLLVHQRDGARRQLVSELLWPVLHLLTKTYALMDILPMEAAATPVPAESRSFGKSPKNRPKPPAGLLSLQQYTDVAVLLEFTVCTSVLPLLDDHVLPEIEDRVKYGTPKSLQGRIHRPTMQWGCAANQAVAHVSPSSTATGAERYWELRVTAALVDRLVQLDRFRPMLLPRHLTDLYAAVWQADFLLESKMLGDNMSSKEDELLRQQSRPFRRAVQELVPETGAADPPQGLNESLLAYTCQRLLLHGRRAPVWLQKCVSQCLQALAYRNLTAVVAVFCPAQQQQQQDPTAASLRLARTLLTGPLRQVKQTNSMEQHSFLLRPIIRQCVVILDQIANSHTKVMAKFTWTESHRVNLYTVWAIMDLLPNHVLLQEVLGQLTQTQEENTAANPRTFHRAIRRLTVLLLMVPPFVNMQRFCKCVFVASLGDKSPSWMQMLLQLSADRPLTKSLVHEDAIYALQLWSQAVLTADFGKVNGLDVWSLLMLSLMTPFCPTARLESTPSEKALEALTVTTVDASSDAAQMVTQLEKRGRFILDQLIRPLSQASVSEANTALPPHLLQILVALYLSCGQGSPQAGALLPTAFTTTEFELTTMVMLPVLCEEFSLESLLADQSSSVPLLQLVGLALRAVSGQIQSSGGSTDLPVPTSVDVYDAGRITMDIVGNLKLPAETSQSSGTGFPEDESKLSIASVLLTLLIGMLELGTKKRNVEEEEILTSFSPHLEQLSQVAVCDFGSALFAEISEMASHANALIAARSVSASTRNDVDEVDPMLGQFLQAKSDLTSAEPPLRARGVVTLRHLTFAAKKGRESVMIESKPSGGESIDLWDITALTIGALADTESYVYLAAIQTLTAAALQDPRYLVQSLSVALSSGKFTGKSKTIHLSLEQRIKLAESLISFIRRQPALNEYARDLLDVLFSATKRNSLSISSKTSELIQAQTHHYFVGENKDNQIEDGGWEQTQLRVNTGGPLFDAEEPDVLRSAAINVVCEVFRVVDPSIIAKHCAVVVECAKLSLQLEASRPVRRSGALLASVLYSALLREIERHDSSAMSKQQVHCPFALAMVSGGEESLASILSRIEKGGDLTDLHEDKGRQYDPATVARCKEALAAREEAESSGILAFVRLSYLSQEETPSILRIVGNSGARRSDGAPLISMEKEDTE
jgi:hypothetical protein